MVVFWRKPRNESRGAARFIRYFAAWIGILVVWHVFVAVCMPTMAASADEPQSMAEQLAGH